MRVMFAKSDDGRLCSWRAEPNEAEKVVNLRVQSWRDGRPTRVGPDLDAMLGRWRALRPGDELVVEWPTRRLPRPAPRVRRTPARRRVGR